MSIGKRLKEARENKNLTQAQLAKKIGITASSITNYENETSHPKEEILLKLFDILGVEPNYLFQDSFTQNDFNCTLAEQEFIRKYRNLDNYGKKAVDSTLNCEHLRCTDDKHFVDYETALEFMRSRPMYAMGGINIEKMHEDILVKWANDFYSLELEAKEYLD